MAHEGFHEPYELLPDDVKDFHRIIQSTMEELEAVDWYHQRAAMATDPQAKAIMEHNRDEEIEHAVMGLEWLRRNNPVFDEMFRTILFSNGPIVAVEAEMTGKAGSEENGAAEAPARKGGLVGGLKGGKK